MFTGLSQTQISGMGTALSQGGTGLLHIAIQLMPYAIAFTIILFIFGLIKNWSKLRDGFQLRRMKRKVDRLGKEELSGSYFDSSYDNYQKLRDKYNRKKYSYDKKYKGYKGYGFDDFDQLF